MTTNHLITRLLELPKLIAAEERSVLEQAADVRHAQYMLEAAEYRLLTALEGPINGKNAETRAAQLTMNTMVERSNLEGVKAAKADAEVRLRELQHELSAARAVARLLARETE